MSGSFVSQDVVLKIGHLARIKIPNERVASLAQEMAGILEWVGELNKIDTQDIKPLANPMQIFIPSTPTQPDEVKDGGYVKEILSNAPEVALDMFVVPKVVE